MKFSFNIILILSAFLTINLSQANANEELDSCEFKALNMAYCRHVKTEKFCQRTASGGTRCTSFPKKLNIYRSYMASGLCCTDNLSKQMYCKQLDVNYQDILSNNFALISTYSRSTDEWNTSGYAQSCPANNVIIIEKF